MVFSASRLYPSQLLTTDATAPALPRGPDAKREEGSGRVLTVPLLIHAPSSFPPVAPPLL
jgi:hypothetical protein